MTLQAVPHILGSMLLRGPGPVALGVEEAPLLAVAVEPTQVQLRHL
jgi:hypothetical protein